MQILRDEHKITTVDEWFQFAPPKRGLRQWVDGRSAKELAKAFIKDGAPFVPAELRALLGSHKELGPVDLAAIFPEYKIPLDQFPGETRNADLAAIGSAGVGKVAVTIEAKADEAFGGTIGDTLAKASPKSNIPKRISALANALFGHSRLEINDLRYQLLHGTAASLIFAQEQDAVAAVFIVLEFRGPKCKEMNLERNSRDFDLFVKALSPRSPNLTIGNLIGPLLVQGGGFIPSGLPLFIGKAILNVSPSPMSQP